MDKVFKEEFKSCLKRWFKSKSLYLAALFLLLVSLGCAFSGEAMLNLLGYEFSILISIFLSQIIALIAAYETSQLQKKIELKKYTEREFALVLFARNRALVVIMSFLAAIPLAVLLLNAFHITNCNIMQGILFYLLIPVVTGLCALLMATSFTLFSKGNAKRGYLLFLAYSILTILVTLWKLYAGPRVGFYNFILGSVVLFNYNTVVPIDAPFLLARSIAFTFAYLTFFLSILGYERNLPGVFLKGLFKSPFTNALRYLLTLINGIVIIYLVILFIYKGPLGIDINTAYLNKLMDGRLVGKGIELRYPSDSPITGEMNRILKEHEWHYARIVEELKLENPPVVTCYIYPTRAQKTKLTGVGGSVFAKPWMAMIHVEYSDYDIRALKHELTHILAGEFGRSIVNISLQTGLCEGLSEASEWDAGALTHHQWAQSIMKGEIDNRASPINTMTNEGFWSQRITVSYYISGSFVRWLIDTYGVEKFKICFIKAGLFFSDKPYKAAYDKTLQELTEEWLQFLKTIPEADEGAALAQYMFQRPAFTEQRCSHEVAERNAEALKALQHKQYKKALRDYDALIKFQPDDPYHGWGKISALVGLENYNQALKLASELMAHPKSNDGYKAQLLRRRGIILAKQQRWSDCRVEVQKALDKAISASMKRDSIIKLAILDHESDELRRLMFKALDTETSDPRFYYQQALMIDANFWPAVYLIGRSLWIDGEYGESVEFLKRFLAMYGYDDMFTKAADLSLIESAFRSEQYELAYLWTDSVFNKDYELSEAEKAKVLKWRDRIVWTWLDLGRKPIELNMLNLTNIIYDAAQTGS
ncbi:hypothetical protein J7L05_12890 [bacterium]|nr:hypothetical protein [bacterium]